MLRVFLRVILKTELKIAEIIQFVIDSVRYRPGHHASPFRLRVAQPLIRRRSMSGEAGAKRKRRRTTWRGQPHSVVAKRRSLPGVARRAKTGEIVRLRVAHAKRFSQANCQTARPSLRGEQATKQSSAKEDWIAEPVIGRAFARPVGLRSQ